jgi:gliding motility-associated-like protein
MVIKITVTIILILQANVIAFSQKQWNRWYFGNHVALDFNTAVPQPLLDSKINTKEGCASISHDETGELLFYTDGITVWDASNSVMVNGDGLLGSSTSTQSALIIPNPDYKTQGPNYGKYYIFTSDAASPLNSGTNGYRYSIVNTNADGNGNTAKPLGAVTEKNKLLLSKHTEKLTAAQHKNGRDFWVIVHERDNNLFYAFLLSSLGVTSTPVISSAGSVVTYKEFGGQMKVSKDGKKIACAYEEDVKETGNTGKVEVFEFNNETGVISPNPIVEIKGIDAYGVEFSPNSHLLYLTDLLVDDLGGDANVALLQYNLAAGSASAIVQSKVVVADDNSGFGFYGSALQLGPDGKIYVAQIDYATFDQTSGTLYSTISVINHPDNIGEAANYIDGGVRLSNDLSHTSQYGLCAIVWITTEHEDCQPVFVNLGGNKILCKGNAITLDAGAGFASYHWSDGSTNQTLEVDVGGTYSVTVINKCGDIGTSLINIEQASAPEITLGPDTLVFTKSYVLYAGTENYRLKWSDNSSDTALTIHSSGEYWVEVTNNCGSTIDSIYVEFRNPYVFIPNILTPNGDNLNDIFFPLGEAVKSYQILILNRWGEVIFVSNDVPWQGKDDHGKEVQTGIYYYSIIIEYPDHKKVYKGDLQLVR